MADPLVQKPAGQRRRRNKPPVAPKVLPAASDRAVPGLPGDREWSERTVAWWSAIWASPMAAIWLESDVHELFRLADLVELTNRGGASAAVLSEVRQLGDRFGLSPLSRRRLQWDVDRALAPQGRPKPRAAAKKGEADARWLRLIRDDG